MDGYQDQGWAAVWVAWGVPLASRWTPSGLVAFGYRSR
jgi:hypothetical protein